MTDQEADALIDRQLRNIAVPADLAARLQRLATWPDDELDQDLAAVPVPSALAARLKDITADLPLDRKLTDLPVPVGLKARLRSLVGKSRIAVQWQRVALQAIALSLLVAAGLGYSAFAWRLLAGSRPIPSSVTTLVFIQPLPLELEAEHGELELVVSSELESDIAIPSPAVVEAAPQEPWSIEEGDGVYPVAEVFLAAQDQRLEKALNRLRWPVLGAPRGQDESPQLALVRLPVARGIATPLTPGYHRAFLFRTNVHPPIWPAANESLQQSLAPLSVATDSFDEAFAAIRRKQRLAADQIRPEDFIAAIEHDLPKPASGELSLTLATAPSMFGPNRARLVGLGVCAGDTLNRQRPSTHLVLAIDFSAGLAKSGSWPWVQEAILETLARMGPHDRVSLVFFQNQVVMGSTPLDRDSADLLRSQLAGARPQGDADPAVGLEAALDVALTAETPAQERHVVLLTDGHFDITAQEVQRVRFLARQASQAGVGIDVLNLSGGRSIAEGPAILSRAMQVHERAVDSRRRLVHTLQGLLHGDEAITAYEVKLVVRFVPDIVAAYRLIGHESNTMAQLITPPMVTELHQGEQALVLFELLPAADSKQEIAAEAELSWIDMATGQPRLLRRQLSRSELMQPWDNASVAFRAAAIAAEGAEQLRGSRAALRYFQWHNEEPVDLSELAFQARALLSTDSPASLRQLIMLLEGVSELPQRERGDRRR